MLLCGADLVDTFTRIKPNGEFFLKKFKDAFKDLLIEEKV